MRISPSPCCLLLSLLTLVGPARAHAQVTIISVTGPEVTTSGSPGIFSTQAVAFSFSVNEPYTNVTIRANLIGSFQGTAYLTDRIGFGTTVLNEIASGPFTSAVPPGESSRFQSVLEGITLPKSSTYYVVLTTNDFQPPQGMLATDEPFVTSDVGASNGPYYSGNPTGAPYPPAAPLAQYTFGSVVTYDVVGMPRGSTCTFELSSSGESFDGQGGAGTFAITTSPTCVWTATTGASWISLDGFGCAGDVCGRRSRTGSGKLTFFVEANPRPAPRTAMISVGGKQFAIEQEGLACIYGVIPTRVTTGSAGGAVPIFVMSLPSCEWSVATTTPWISVSSAQTIGKGTVMLTVGANGGLARRGTVVVAGHAVTVDQSAPSAPGQPVMCGSAVDVTDSMDIYVSGYTPVDIFGRFVRQEIRVTNRSRSTILGPLFLVFVGLPTSHARVVGTPGLTTCFSTDGDTIALMNAAVLQPGHNTGFLPLISRDEWWMGATFTPKVLSGLPPLK